MLSNFHISAGVDPRAETTMDIWNESLSEAIRSTVELRLNEHARNKRFSCSESQSLQIFFSIIHNGCD